MMFFSPGANVFQSTLPLRGATSPLSPVLDFLFISIHALHEESDGRMASPLFLNSLFQSTLSMRRATWVRRDGRVVCLFQSTLSMRRATGKPTVHRIGTH